MTLSIQKPQMPLPDFRPLDHVLIDSCGLIMSGRILQVIWNRSGISYLCEFSTNGYIYERNFLADELKPAPRKKNEKKA